VIVEGESISSHHAALQRGRLHYRSAGTGPPVVALHGWPGYSADWRAVMVQASTFAHVIAPDFFGFGESGPLTDPATEAASEEAFASDIVELLDSLAIEQAVLAGYDIGSAVAPAVARLAPERVAGLVLLNPTNPGLGDPRRSPDMIAESWYQHFHVLPLASRLLDGNVDALRLYLGHFYNHWGGMKKITTAELAEIVRVYSRPGAFSASTRWYQARLARGRRPKPDSLSTPTIALWGDRDPMRPIGHREGFESAFPGSRSHVLPGVGHFVPQESPSSVVAALSGLMT
jgi:pimeloyl-ACP methyl ester carboxylesterase